MENNNKFISWTRSLIIIILLAAIVLMAVVFVLFLEISIDSILFIFGMLLAYIIILISARDLYSLIIINKMGVEYKKIFSKKKGINWQDVNEIGIGSHSPYNKLDEYDKWIYISTSILSHEQKYKLGKFKISNKIIKFKYSKKRVNILKKYIDLTKININDRQYF